MRVKVMDVVYQCDLSGRMVIGIVEKIESVYYALDYPFKRIELKYDNGEIHQLFQWEFDRCFSTTQRKAVKKRIKEIKATMKYMKKTLGELGKTRDGKDCDVFAILSKDYVDYEKCLARLESKLKEKQDEGETQV